MRFLILEIETEAKARHQRKVPKLSLSFFVYVSADKSWREGKNLEWEYHCVHGRVGSSFLCVYKTVQQVSLR